MINQLVGCRIFPNILIVPIAYKFYKMNDPVFLVVDLFCGAGGTTTGFAKAQIEGREIVKVIACVNHDAKAIKSHWLNHPEVKHFNEDIRTLDLTDLMMHVKNAQDKFPFAKLILWASLECTNFSKAKGGLSRNADSRTLADHLIRYEEALQPDYIMIENVVEFMSWGPLDGNGKPLSRRNGEDFMRWCNEITSKGYWNEWKELNSADYGAYTSRNRLFGCFAKHGLPIVWPEATHSKKGSVGMFTHLQKWKAVKEVLNFEDEGESIFCRKKPLSDKTLERIYSGLIKYIAKGDTVFLSNYKTGHPMSKNTSVDTVSGTLTCIPTQSLVTTSFLLKYNSINGKTGVHHPPSVEDPAPVVSCQGRLGLVQAKFLNIFYGNGFTSSIDAPCPTLTTKDRASLISPTYFIDRQYGNGTKHQTIDEPAGTITQVPKLNVVACSYFLLNPQFKNNGSSIEKPCFTLIAKMDKRPPYLIEVEPGCFAIEVKEEDSDMARKIKLFMAAYGLIDIKMRMLRVAELLKIQGFPANYELVGTQADQKKFIGNSVVPDVVKCWIEAFAENYIYYKLKTA
jgi:DNA (cytosine-5)-methyltransferase 1